MLQDYAPVLLHFLIVTGLAAAIIGLSAVVGPRLRNAVKLAPYECGIAPVGTARERFSVKFYLVAMLFILFDVEVIFFFPGPLFSGNLAGSASSRWAPMSGYSWQDTFTSGKKAPWIGIAEPPELELLNRRLKGFPSPRQEGYTGTARSQASLESGAAWRENFDIQE